MNSINSRGLLSVEEMNALFEERLRVNLPGGSFKVIHRKYSGASGSMTYEHQLPLSMVVRLQPEGHILPLNATPAVAKSDNRS